MEDLQATPARRVAGGPRGVGEAKLEGARRESVAREFRARMLDADFKKGAPMRDVHSAPPCRNSSLALAVPDAEATKCETKGFVMPVCEKAVLRCGEG